MKKLFALLLAMAMLVALSAGCASEAPAPAEEPAPSQEAEAPAEPSEAAPADEQETPPAEQAPETAPEAETPPEPVVYELPLTDEPTVFTHWGEGQPPFVMQVLGSEQSFNTAQATDYMEEITGIRIKYTEVDMFSKSEKFNLMVASGDFTDMMCTFDSMYSGGTAKAYADEVIVDLTDYVVNNMPAYYQIVKEQNLETDLLNDDGQFLLISGIDDEVFPQNGPCIRQDWLDKVNMEMPNTYDELHEAAVAFKNELGAEIPLFFTASLNPGVWFSGAFDIPAFDIKSNGSHFFQIDGKVQSAYVQDSLKDMIKLMAKYYEEELISRDFISRENGQDYEADLFSGKVGVFTAPSGFITDYNKMPDNQAVGFHAVGLPNITKEDGQIIHFTTNSSNGTGRNNICISTLCEDVELLTTFLDFQFTEQGQLINNYGMEGETYEFDAEGNPQFLAEIPNSGIAFMQATRPFVINGMPSFFDADLSDQRTLDADAFAARALYSEKIDGAYDLPFAMEFSVEESEVFSSKISDVDTYAAEFLLKCIYGEQDIDAGWDAYVDRLYELGLQQCIDAKQSCYDRYLAR